MRARINFKIAVGKEDKEDLFKNTGMVFKEGLHGREGDRRGLFDGKAVGPRGNGRKCYCFQRVLFGQDERIAVARGQKLRFVIFSAIPNGAYRMNHMTGRQIIAPRDPGSAGLAPAESPAFF